MKQVHTIELWVILDVKLVSWIRFGIRRQRAMMSIIMLCPAVQTFKGTMAARMSAGEIFEHERDAVRKRNVLQRVEIRRDRA